MAPFLTHLVVGARVWAELDGAMIRTKNGTEAYGTFLFGCLAPDVDKLTDSLDQATTHFMIKDEAGNWTRQRTQHFLDHQSDFLRAPFEALESDEQAFVLGYLCHVATDEVSGRAAQQIEGRTDKSAKNLPHVDAILTAIDPKMWAMVAKPANVQQSLAAAKVPEAVLPFVGPNLLRAQYDIVVPQVAQGGGLDPFINMLRRTRQWQRHGWVSDETDDPELEAELASFRQQIASDLPASERLVETLPLDSFVEEATSHSMRRLYTLAGKRSE